MKTTWDAGKVRAVAATCFNKAEFKKKAYGAYRYAHRHGLIYELFPNKKVFPIRRWGLLEIKIEAAKYATKREFEIGCPSAYVAANKRHPGLLSELFGSVKTQPAYRWGDEVDVRAEGLKYPSRIEFARYANGAHLAAKRMGILDDMFPRRIVARWTEAMIRTEAKNYATIAEFIRGSGSAYNAGRRLGIIDSLGFPEDRAPSDNNAIYIWRAVGQHYNGNPVYKIGVTSARLGINRILRCSRSNGFEFDLVCCERVQCKATELERKLLMLGEDPCFLGFDGATEFRALSDSALYAAVSMIASEVCDVQT